VRTGRVDVLLGRRRAADPRPCASQALQVLSSPGGL